jgi:hypothetical protein
MKELHDGMDAEVARAYGWPDDLSDEEILGRLLSLNRQRTAEEAKGDVRWLRPEYQIPRFGTSEEKEQLDLAGGDMREAVSVRTAKEKWPSDDIGQTAAVMAVLASATAPLGADAIAASFKQGRKCASGVRAVLASLARMGHVDSGERGKTFLLRRAG